MTAKKPRFEPRVLDRSKGTRCFFLGTGMRYLITDARDLTAEQAVQKVFKNIAELYTVTPEGLNRLLVGTDMTATIDENGKVCVMRAKP